MRGALRAALVCGAALLAVPATAGAAVTKLPTATETLTVPAAATHSCADHQSAAAPGVVVRSYTAKADGAVQMRLRGDERNDWDLSLFDAASGRNLAASQAWGANEVVAATVRKGQVLAIQACRERGSASHFPLTIAGSPRRSRRRARPRPPTRSSRSRSPGRSTSPGSKGSA